MIVKIKDLRHIQVATIQISEVNGNQYTGQLIESDFNTLQLDTLKEFEDCVNNQVFSILDDLAARIDTFGFFMADENTRIYDFQLFGDQVSFSIEGVIHNETNC